MSSVFLCIRQYIHKYSYVKWIDPANVQHKIYTLMASNEYFNGIAKGTKK